jgi:hypothetical protein
VDVPSDASETPSSGWANGRVLTCVRPLPAAFDMPRARMEIRRIGSISPPCALRRLSPATGFPAPTAPDGSPITATAPAAPPQNPEGAPSSLTEGGNHFPRLLLRVA